MTVEKAAEYSPRMWAALSELKTMIRARFPKATFSVTSNPDDHEAVLLRPVVDVEDRDEIMDIIIDRLGELQSEDGLPIFVVPIRPRVPKQP